MQTMWSTSLFKTNAKANFNLSYWPFVAVSVLLILLNSEFFTIQFQTYVDDISWLAPYSDYFTNSAVLPWEEWSYRILYRFHLPWFLLLAIQLLVTNPYEVGACRFFLDNNGSQRAPFSVTIQAGFQRNFGNIVLTQFLRNLFIFLWSLLFIIPGIIRSFAYFAVPYILAENPDLDHNRVLRLSIEMTRGHKMDIFLTMLSFFFWFCLEVITLDIVGIFYVEPYFNATKAEMYRFLRFEALQKGIAAPGELPGSGVGDTQWRAV